MLLGIDIGGTSIKIGVFDLDFALIHKNTIPTQSFKNAASFFDFLLGEINILATQFNIKSVGIGIPGLLTEDLILEKSPNLKFLEKVDLIDLLIKKMPLPSVIQNDANMAIHSELVGQGFRDLKNIFYMTLGTGIGGALMIDGKIFRGDIGFAGEIGHIAVESNFENVKFDYRNGTLESFCGRQGIIDYFRKLTNFKGDIDVENITTLAESGHLNALKTIDRTAFYISTGIVTVVHLLSISNFIIGGGIANSDYLLEKIKYYVNERVMFENKNTIHISRARHSEDSGIYGAAYCAKAELESIKFKEKS